MDHPRCQRESCINLVTEKYKRKWRGWKKYCSKECTNLARFENMKTTMVERYGVENSMQLDSTKEKLKTTMVERYGVENSMQLDSTKDKLKTTMVERYGVEHQMSLDSVKNKIKNTVFKRYGVDSVSQIPEVKFKKIQTSLKNYGVENPFISDVVKEKIKNTMIEKYGVISNNYLHISPDSLEKLKNKDWCEEFLKSNSISDFEKELKISKPLIIKNLKDHGIINEYVSNFENDVQFYLDSLQIDYIKRSRKIIPPLELDFYLPKHNLAIECNGTYWHSDLNGKDKNYHLNKTTLCREKNIHLIHLWEHDWAQKNQIIKHRIKSKLGLCSIKYARKTTIKVIDNVQSELFLNQYHFQGSCPSSIRYGLFENNQLMAVMTFGKSRFSKQYQYELLRLAYAPDISIVGGASKLFKNFCRDHSPTSVISYSDRTWNTGSVYKKIGFRYSHSSPPSYWYSKDYLHFENRIKFQKHKLPKLIGNFLPELTEWENMSLNGYDRIWDCGTDVWIWLDTTKN
jgi:hypothetical protein